MRNLLVSVAIATATLAAVPAAAQYRGQDSGWNQRGQVRPAVHNLLAKLNQVDQRIDRSERRRVISAREAYGLKREANQVRNQIHFAGRNGLDRREFAQLQYRVDRLEQRLLVERRDGDGRRL